MKEYIENKLLKVFKNRVNNLLLKRSVLRVCDWAQGITNGNHKLQNLTK